MPDDKPVIFNAAARARIARSVHWTESGEDPQGRSPRDPPFRWGKLTADWSSATPKQVTVNYCRQNGTEPDTAREIRVYLSSPLATVPTFCLLKKEDVICFIPVYDLAAEEWRGIWLGRDIGTATTPAVLLPSAEDHETETAQTDTWDRAAPPSGKDGVQIVFVTRVAYNEAGDKVLYEFTRTAVYDSCGQLKTVSAETRHTVDTPVECP